MLEQSSLLDGSVVWADDDMISQKADQYCGGGAVQIYKEMGCSLVSKEI